MKSALWKIHQIILEGDEKSTQNLIWISEIFSFEKSMCNMNIWISTVRVEGAD